MATPPVARRSFQQARQGGCHTPAGGAQRGACAGPRGSRLDAVRERGGAEVGQLEEVVLERRVGALQRRVERQPRGLIAAVRAEEALPRGARRACVG